MCFQALQGERWTIDQESLRESISIRIFKEGIIMEFASIKSHQFTSLFEPLMRYDINEKSIQQPGCKMCQDVLVVFKMKILKHYKGNSIFGAVFARLTGSLRLASLRPTKAGMG